MTAGAGGTGAPLGTIAKSLHAGGWDTESTRKAEVRRINGARARRVEMLRAAQSALWIAGDATQKQHRTCWCHRTMQRDTLPVMLAADGRSRLGGVNTCGSVWTCPSAPRASAKNAPPSCCA